GGTPRCCSSGIARTNALPSHAHGGLGRRFRASWLMDATRKGAGFMRWKLLAVLAAAAAIGGGGTALATHSVVDPSTVPTGFLAAHNFVGRVPVSSFFWSVHPHGGAL